MGPSPGHRGLSKSCGLLAHHPGILACVPRPRAMLVSLIAMTLGFNGKHHSVCRKLHQGANIYLLRHQTSQWSGQPGGTKLGPPVRLWFVLQPEDALSGRALFVVNSLTKLSSASSPAPMDSRDAPRYLSISVEQHGHVRKAGRGRVVNYGGESQSSGMNNSDPSGSMTFPKMPVRNQAQSEGRLLMARARRST